MLKEGKKRECPVCAVSESEREREKEESEGVRGPGRKGLKKGRRPGNWSQEVQLALKRRT